MAAKFSPLVLPQQLHDLPHDYGQHVKKLNGEDEVSAQQHLVWFDDYCDIENMDDEDIKMRLFALSFSGDVKQWLRSLTNLSIRTFQEFETLFLRKWEKKKNTLQLITQYNSMKRNPVETIQDFSARFLKIYNSIPSHVKPPIGAAQLQYAEAFDGDFA